MSSPFKLLATLFLFCAFFLRSAFAADPISSIRSGDDWMKEISEANLQQALTQYEAALEVDPQNYEANWKAARALCFLLDLKTSQLIEERDEYKPFLKDLGAKAEFYGKRAYEIDPKGLEGLTWYAGAYSYHAASMGIVSAILKGAGSQLKELANQLIELNDSYHGAFGYRILGRLNLKAPFPVGSKKRAIEYLEKAVEKSPDDLLNHYWLGEAYRHEKKYEGARKQYQFVLDNPPKDIEAHVIEPFKVAARTHLEETTQ